MNLQYFYAYFPAAGWSVGTSPNMLVNCRQGFSALPDGRQMPRLRSLIRLTFVCVGAQAIRKLLQTNP